MKKEYEIAELWEGASVKVMPANEGITTRLQDKSNFWSDKIEWSWAEVIDKGIDFSAIEYLKRIQKNMRLLWRCVIMPQKPRFFSVN